MTGKSSDPATPGRVTDSKRGYRVGVDIGGTFTDLALLAGDGSVFTRTLLTSPDQHGRVVVEGLGSLLAGLQRSPDLLDRIVCGTTAATNATLETNGARTGVIDHTWFSRRAGDPPHP